MNLYDNIHSGDIDTVIFPDKEFDILDACTYGLLMCISRDIDFKRINRKEIDQYRDKPNYLLVSIGLGEFDNNQAMFRLRPGTNVKMSSLSLLWEALGEDVVGHKELSDYVKSSVIEKIEDAAYADHLDNVTDITNILLSFKPEWNEPDVDDNDRFFEAARYMMITFERLFCHYNMIDQTIDLITAAYDEAPSDALYIEMNSYLPLFNLVKTLNDDIGKNIRAIVYPVGNKTGVYYVDTNETKEFDGKETAISSIEEM